jgi:hypothetical protein
LAAWSLSQKGPESTVANTRIAGLHGMLERISKVVRLVGILYSQSTGLNVNVDAINRVKLGIFISRDSPQKFKVSDLRNLIFLLVK